MPAASTRGGARHGAGRKATLVHAKPYKVTLDASTAGQLKQVGGGNLSAGIRAAAAALDKRPSVAMPAQCPGDTALPHAAGSVDPRTVCVSRWHGRLPPRGASLVDFERLKREVLAARRNVAPVLLCQARGTANMHLVYGSLRLRACLELGLPLFAVVMDLTERELFETMIRESARGWSTFELGVSLKRALDGGLYPTLRRLASECGLELSLAAIAVEAASLPEHVLRVIDSPDRMTAVNVRSLVAAMSRDPDGVKTRAAGLADRPQLSPARVVSALVQSTVPKA